MTDTAAPVPSPARDIIALIDTVQGAAQRGLTRGDVDRIVAIVRSTDLTPVVRIARVLCPGNPDPSDDLMAEAGHIFGAVRMFDAGRTTPVELPPTVPFWTVRDETDANHGWSYDHQRASAGPFTSYSEAAEYLEDDDRFVIVQRPDGAPRYSTVGDLEVLPVGAILLSDAADEGVFASALRTADAGHCWAMTGHPSAMTERDLLGQAMTWILVTR